MLHYTTQYCIIMYTVIITVFSEYAVYGRDSIKSVFSITGQYSQSMQCMIEIASSQYSLSQASILRVCNVWRLHQVSILYYSSVFSEYAEYGDSIRSVFSITD